MICFSMVFMRATQFRRGFSPSVEQLRAKLGKTMGAPCVAGHSGTFAEVVALCDAQAGQMFPAQVLPDLQGNGLVRAKKPFY